MFYLQSEIIRKYLIYSLLKQRDRIEKLEVEGDGADQAGIRRVIDDNGLDGIVGRFDQVACFGLFDALNLLGGAQEVVEAGVGKKRLEFAQSLRQGR